MFTPGVFFLTLAPLDRQDLQDLKLKSFFSRYICIDTSASLLVYKTYKWDTSSTDENSVQYRRELSTKTSITKAHQRNDEVREGDNNESREQQEEPSKEDVVYG